MFLNLEGKGEGLRNHPFHVFLFISCPLSLHLCISSLLCPRSVYVLDKLDEILAAAQHTITPDNQGQRGHGGKRDRSKSIVPNVSTEVQLGI